MLKAIALLASPTSSGRNVKLVIVLSSGMSSVIRSWWNVPEVYDAPSCDNGVSSVFSTKFAMMAVAYVFGSWHELVQSANIQRDFSFECARFHFVREGLPLC